MVNQGTSGLCWAPRHCCSLCNMVVYSPRYIAYHHHGTSILSPSDPFIDSFGYRVILFTHFSTYWIASLINPSSVSKQFLPRWNCLINGCIHRVGRSLQLYWRSLFQSCQILSSQWLIFGISRRDMGRCFFMRSRRQHWNTLWPSYLLLLGQCFR